MSAASLLSPTSPRSARVLLFPVALVAAWVFAACGGGGGGERAVQPFLDLLRQGEVSTAYRSAATVMQLEETAASFDGRIREAGISRFESCQWAAGEQAGTFTGTLRSRTGIDFSISLRTVRDGGGWKVSSFQFRPADEAGKSSDAQASQGNLSFSETGQREAPTAGEAHALAAESLKVLARSASAGDFTELFGHISAIWQSQVSVVRLQRAFGRLGEQEGGIGWVADAEFELIEPPVLNRQGLLIVQGKVKGDRPFAFLFRYVYELPDWKLFGVEATLRAASETAAP